MALIDCVKNPGVMGSPEFMAAVKTLSTDKSLWFGYRTKIKSAKPSGVPIADIDCMGTVWRQLSCPDKIIVARQKADVGNHQTLSILAVSSRPTADRQLLQINVRFFTHSRPS